MALHPGLVAASGRATPAPTLELKVQFLRPARTGPLIGRGRVVHRGPGVAFLAGELLDEAGTVVATATDTARIVSRSVSSR